jgi:hypothetical protein
MKGPRRLWRTWCRGTRWSRPTCLGAGGSSTPTPSESFSGALLVRSEGMAGGGGTGMLLGWRMQTGTMGYAHGQRVCVCLWLTCVCVCMPVVCVCVCARAKVQALAERGRRQGGALRLGPWLRRTRRRRARHLLPRSVCVCVCVCVCASSPVLRTTPHPGAPCEHVVSTQAPARRASPRTTRPRTLPPQVGAAPTSLSSH